jgi:hypothetical protein
LGFVVEQMAQKIDEEHVKTQFITNLTPGVVEMVIVFTMISKQVFK